MHEAKYLPHYTVADYRQWEGNWELIGGIPYAMSPSPIRKHQNLGVALIGQISSQLKQHKECGMCQLVYDLDWIVEDDTVLRPDLAITCNQQDNFITAPPSLIIEILSASTAFNDRQIKFEIYERKGVQYYILLNPENKTKNIFYLQNGKYEERIETDFVIHKECNIKIDFEKAFLEI